MAPRRQLATSYNSHASPSNPFAGNSQVSTFEKTGKRTIVVEGTAEFNQVPDIVHLSFLINETGGTLEEGIQKVLSKIATVRDIAAQCGLSNEKISSDSIGSKAKKTEIGYYYKPSDNDNNNNSNNRGVAADEVFRLCETKIEYEVKSVVRLLLEGESVVEQSFSKLLYLILSKAGLRTHEAPTYEISDIAARRNTARTEACENAKSKANSIVQALGDDTIQLGPPICLNDIFVNLTDDAEDSFLGNSWALWETNRQIVPPPDNKTDNDDEEEEDVNMDVEPSAKKAKTEDGIDQESSDAANATTAKPAPTPLEDAVIDKIFVVPCIKIAARIEAIFEILIDGNEMGKLSGGDQKVETEKKEEES